MARSRHFLAVLEPFQRIFRSPVAIYRYHTYPFLYPTMCFMIISCGYTHLLPEVSQGVLNWLGLGSAWVPVALYFPVTVQIIT